jgi:hypothetical protein
MRLDTGADSSLVAERVIRDLGLHLQPYHGPALLPFGEESPPVTPVGEIQLRWFMVPNGGTTLTTLFRVIKDKQMRDLDSLLGFADIGSNRILGWNRNICILTMNQRYIGVAKIPSTQTN